jgi:hypothetical protein
MRHDDWQERYNRHIKTCGALPFEWGLHDCVTFAIDTVDAISDLDLWPRVREKYVWHSETEALAIIAKAGSLQALVEEFLGPAGRWVYCTTGDIVLATNVGRDILTVNDGHNLIVPRETGLGALTLAHARVAWRI